MKTIEVIHEAADKLSRTVWDFWFDDRDAELVLRNYSIQSRKTRRHSYISEAWYSRLHDRRDGIRAIGAIGILVLIVWLVNKDNQNGESI